VVPSLKTGAVSHFNADIGIKVGNNTIAINVLTPMSGTADP